ncbi:hypothetical protein DICPUDRAFT_57109 [Dictyostelium purpureum]|uniref:Carbohydrate binding domain-containing protein n=1 Tax=Dictyostelium purpureum TaxID=5786 RepID=F0ZUD3_DICPU|nr:uncharacterized protein DICPUDRAFT_57109 [Dictyostelium purpureum]EGC32448.1 hypothetical protein DICPUDRAFT_57109 [Dictyostelium purpureum]|eukprot:XP_003291020.1 hypothetical protein DICPUDRAFT_57109 [Dictyostelium purpureum]
MYIKLALVLIFAFFAFALADNTLSISQIQTGGWGDSDPYTVWEVTLTNTGMRTIIDATIIAESNLKVDKPEQMWSLECVSPDKYHFPSFLVQNGLTNGTYHKFGYINHSGEPAIFTACDIIYK